MDVSTPPILDLACPQAEADIEKYVHMYRDKGVDKIKYGHEGIMVILIIASYKYTILDIFYDCEHSLKYDMLRVDVGQGRRMTSFYFYQHLYL